MLVCNICNNKYKLLSSLTRHIIKYHKEISIKEYYDKFYKKDGEGLCRNCGKESKFYKFSYSKSCCRSCHVSYCNNENWKNTDYKLKMTELGRERWKDDKFRDRMIEDFKDRWTRPEFVDKMAANLFGKTGRGVKGYFNHKKDLYFDSTYEAAFIYLYGIKQNNNIIRCPRKYTVDYKDSTGKDRKYFPDLYDIDLNIIFEIKPLKHIQENFRECNTKIDSAKSKYKELNINYEIITEKDLGEIKEIFTFLVKENLISLYNKKLEKEYLNKC